jgi:DNA-binding MarR family transcriptional regulator
VKPVQKAKQGKAAAVPRARKPALKIPEPGRCNGLSLRKATRRISQLYDAFLTPCGLRSTQRSILLQIARSGMPSMGELADALVLDRSALAHNLKPLERDGLVETIIDPDDGRARLAILTDAGHAKLVQSMPLWENAQRCFEKAFGVRNAEALRTSLAFLASEEFTRAFERAEAARWIAP